MLSGTNLFLISREVNLGPDGAKFGPTMKRGRFPTRPKERRFQAKLALERLSRVPLVGGLVEVYSSANLLFRQPATPDVS
jgi:hypothetical protein